MPIGIGKLLLTTRRRVIKVGYTAQSSGLGRHQSLGRESVTVSEALGDSWNISDAPFPAAHQPTEQLRFLLQHAILSPTKWRCNPPRRSWPPRRRT
jgi:hypothetical protein